MAILYASVFLVALIGVISLAVDWGRVQTAKTEMQDACDAAARYAAAGLYDNSYVTKAQQAAGQNKVDGTTLALQPGDVMSGNWSTSSRTFTAGGLPINAVRVIGRRTDALNNAVPLLFGRIVGANTASVQATSIARQSSLAAVGIDSLTLSGYGTIQRRPGEAGGVMVASNGNYATGTNTTIGGDVLYRIAPSLVGTVTGRVTQLPSDFTFPAPVVPGGTSNYSSIYVTSGVQPASGKIYVAGDAYIGGTTSFVLYSDTYLYVAGNTTFTGTVTCNPNGYRFFLFSLNAGTVSYSNSNPLPAIVYAPGGTVTMSNGAVNGSVVGKNVTISNTLNYNATSAIPAKPTGGGDPMAAGGVITMK